MQLYIRVGFSLPTQASFFLVCTGDSMGAGYCLRVMPRPAMLFAVDIALLEQVEGRLELWRTRLEDIGLKLNKKKMNTYRHLENRRTSS